MCYNVVLGKPMTDRYREIPFFIAKCADNPSLTLAWIINILTSFPKSVFSFLIVVSSYASRYYLPCLFDRFSVYLFGLCLTGWLIDRLVVRLLVCWAACLFHTLSVSQLNACLFVYLNVCLVVCLPDCLSDFSYKHT